MCLSYTQGTTTHTKITKHHHHNSLSVRPVYYVVEFFNIYYVCMVITYVLLLIAGALKVIFIIFHKVKCLVYCL